MLVYRRKTAAAIAAFAFILVGAPAAMAGTVVHVDVPGAASVDVVVEDADDGLSEDADETPPQVIEERTDEYHSESHTVRRYSRR